jgi:hypothetical protein
MTTEAIFGSPYPGYMAHGFDRATGREYRIIFSAGEYTTSDPDEITFLQGIAADERGRAVFVKRLPVAADADDDALPSRTRRSNVLLPVEKRRKPQRRPYRQNGA